MTGLFVFINQFVFITIHPTPHRGIYLSILSQQAFTLHATFHFVSGGNSFCFEILRTHMEQTVLFVLTKTSSYIETMYSSYIYSMCQTGKFCENYLTVLFVVSLTCLINGVKFNIYMYCSLIWNTTIIMSVQFKRLKLRTNYSEFMLF